MAAKVIGKATSTQMQLVETWRLKESKRLQKINKPALKPAVKKHNPKPTTARGRRRAAERAAAAALEA